MNHLAEIALAFAMDNPYGENALAFHVADEEVDNCARFISVAEVLVKVDFGDRRHGLIIYYEITLGNNVAVLLSRFINQVFIV